MNDREIAIIIHNTNELACMETIDALQKIVVPENFEVDVIPVEGAEKYRAYNFAMSQSDAKYKIYLDVNISIRQKNILAQILKIFQDDEKIGVIGTSGAIQLSTHGICLNSKKRCGKIFSSAGNVIDWGGFDGDFCEVEAVDGFFMATQYDFPWREDLFADNYFGDAAQCLEFRRQGYKSVVVKQKSPWLQNRLPDCPIDEEFQRIFLEEYSAEIFPLISVIIPTFNRPKYFSEALESVLSQTYRNFEIVVSDNSTNDDTENLIQPYLEKYSCIKYFHHKNFGANENWNFARQYNNPDAEYVNFLMDDDLFYPRKFEVMVEIYRNNPNVSLVTSFRDVIDENGKIIGKLPILTAFQKVSGGDFTVNGAVAGKYMLMVGKNFIGEPSTVLIRKKFLRDNDLCWNADEAGFFPLVDISTWCQLLSQGDLFFVEEKLNAFRRHKAQATNFDKSGSVFDVCWAKLFKTAWDKKIFIETEDEIRSRIINWLMSGCRRLLKANMHTDEFVVTLEKTMIAMLEALHNGYQINLPEKEYLSGSRNIFS